ncbi:MAG: hypothetical protein ACK5HT_11360, partial [Draconibacterium sp.]
MNFYFKILLSASMSLTLLLISFKSNTNSNAPPILLTEQLGLNDRITTQLSEFNKSGYIEREMGYFMKRWDLKGVSVAVAKDDKLIYAQGFGMAD